MSAASRLSDLSPSECPGVFHDGIRDGSNAHGQCIKIRTRPSRKFPPRRLCHQCCYHFTCAAPSLAVVIVAVAGVAGALAFGALANEREFERLIADGDQAVAGRTPLPGHRGL